MRGDGVAGREVETLQRGDGIAVVVGAQVEGRVGMGRVGDEERRGEAAAVVADGMIGGDKGGHQPVGERALRRFERLRHFLNHLNADERIALTGIASARLRTPPRRSGVTGATTLRGHILNL